MFLAVDVPYHFLEKSLFEIHSLVCFKVDLAISVRCSVVYEPNITSILCY